MRYNHYLATCLLSVGFSSSVFATDNSVTIQNIEASSVSQHDTSNDDTTNNKEPLRQKLTVNATADQPDTVKDPFEAFNRKVYAFNDVLDRNILRPVAVQYIAKVPTEVRGSYHSFRTNLGEPWNAINQTAQGRPKRALQTVGRFLLNTVTTLGLADPASRLNLPQEQERFGTTLGYWGVSSGPFVMLPFLGPSTVRDTFGTGIDFFGYPQNYINNPTFFWSDATLRLIDTRSELVAIDGALQGDKYAQLRDIYLQRKLFLIDEKKGIGATFIDDVDDDSSDNTDSDNTK